MYHKRQDILTFKNAAIAYGLISEDEFTKLSSYSSLQNGLFQAHLLVARVNQAKTIKESFASALINNIINEKQFEEINSLRDLTKKSSIAGFLAKAVERKILDQQYERYMQVLSPIILKSNTTYTMDNLISSLQMELMNAHGKETTPQRLNFILENKTVAERIIPNQDQTSAIMLAYHVSKGHISEEHAERALQKEFPELKHDYTIYMNKDIISVQRSFDNGLISVKEALEMLINGTDQNQELALNRKVEIQSRVKEILSAYSNLDLDIMPDEVVKMVTNLAKECDPEKLQRAFYKIAPAVEFFESLRELKSPEYLNLNDLECGKNTAIALQRYFISLEAKMAILNHPKAKVFYQRFQTTVTKLSDPLAIQELLYDYSNQAKQVAVN